MQHNVAPSVEWGESYREWSDGGRQVRPSDKVTFDIWYECVCGAVRCDRLLMSVVGMCRET